MVETYSFTSLNKTVPDGLASGVSDVQTISSAIDSIGSMTIDLHVVGGFNGDLYCYLRHGSGLSVLLNRPGRTATDSFGYGDSGFNVTFSDGAANGDIHSYQAVVVPMSGILTGTWQPDGRNINPDIVTDASSRTAFLNSFSGSSASGEWTLFIADLQDGGGTSVLSSWGMQITPVPEPVSVALSIFGAISLLVAGCRIRFRR